MLCCASKRNCAERSDQPLHQPQGLSGIVQKRLRFRKPSSLRTRPRTPCRGAVEAPHRCQLVGCAMQEHGGRLGSRCSGWRQCDDDGGGGWQRLRLQSASGKLPAWARACCTFSQLTAVLCPAAACCRVGESSKHSSHCHKRAAWKRSSTTGAPDVIMPRCRALLLAHSLLCRYIRDSGAC